MLVGEVALGCGVLANWVGDCPLYCRQQQLTLLLLPLLEQLSLFTAPSVESNHAPLLPHLYLFPRLLAIAH